MLQIPNIRSAALAIALTLAATPAIAGPYTSIVNPGAGTGSERCVTGGAGSGTLPGTTTIPQLGGLCAAQGAYGGLTSVVQLFANSQGASLIRVPDANDQVWTANPGAGVFGLGRSASNSFTLGYLPGASGGALNAQGINTGFTPLLGAIGAAGAPAVYLPAPFIAGLPAAENANNDLTTGTTQGLGAYFSNGSPNFLPVSVANPFRFAIEGSTVTRLWSSLPADNAPFEAGDTTVDHLVTWQLSSPALTAAGATEYVASFENASFATGGDGDFNDYTFVFLNVNPVGFGVPEPDTLALLGCFLPGLVLLRARGRRKKA